MFSEEQEKEANSFYREALELLNNNGASYMVGGGFAFFHYTGIYRDTKDLDIFCRSAEYPRILKLFNEKGYKIELTDARWLAKAFKGEYYIDIIFDTANNICRIDETWYKHAIAAEFAGVSILLIPPEELIWCKLYVQNRERFDGADVNHLLLKCGRQLDWQRMRVYMEQHWHILLAQIIMFQFVYPADYPDIIPKWLFDELMARAHEQYDLPVSVEKVCRGPIIDQTQYSVDIKEWNYKVITIKTV